MLFLKISLTKKNNSFLLLFFILLGMPMLMIKLNKIISFWFLYDYNNTTVCVASRALPIHGLEKEGGALKTILCNSEDVRGK